MFSPEVLDKERLARHVTRLSARKQIHVEEAKYETSIQCVGEYVVEVHISSEKEYMTTKILKRQLKEAQDEIVEMRGKNRKMKERIEEHLDLCQEALENRKIMVKRSLPLHKQMKNIQKKNRALKTKDGLIKEQMAKRNLDLLAQVAMEQFDNTQDKSCFFFLL